MRKSEARRSQEVKKRSEDIRRKTFGEEGSKRRRRKNQKRSGRRRRREPRKEKENVAGSSPQLLGLAPSRIADGHREEGPVRPHPGAPRQRI